MVYSFIIAVHFVFTADTIYCYSITSDEIIFSSQRIQQQALNYTSYHITPGGSFILTITKTHFFYMCLGTRLAGGQRLRLKKIWQHK